MSDLIRRQDAIDAVTRAIWHYPNESYKNLNVYEVTEALVSDAINSLPSAEQKTGEWTNAGGVLTVHCSNCKSEFHELEAMNYCPNCGADMRGEEER